MKQFKVKFARTFEVDVAAENGAVAQAVADSIMAQFPADSCTLLSIIAEDHVEGECAGCAVDMMKPYGKPKGPPGGPPNMGGSPATPVIRLPVLEDQIAAAA